MPVTIAVYSSSRNDIAQRVADLLAADPTLASMTVTIGNGQSGRYAVRVTAPANLSLPETLQAFLAVDAAVLRIIQSCADIRGGGVVRPTPPPPSLIRLPPVRGREVAA